MVDINRSVNHCTFMDIIQSCDCYAWTVNFRKYLIATYKEFNVNGFPPTKNETVIDACRRNPRHHSQVTRSRQVSGIGVFTASSTGEV